MHSIVKAIVELAQSRNDPLAESVYFKDVTGTNTASHLCFVSENQRWVFPHFMIPQGYLCFPKYVEYRIFPQRVEDAEEIVTSIHLSWELGTIVIWEVSVYGGGGGEAGRGKAGTVEVNGNENYQWLNFYAACDTSDRFAIVAVDIDV